MKLRSAFRPLLAAFAILLSPGALAPWLQLAHACPMAEGAAPRQGQHQHGHTHDQPGHRPVCQCVGTCHAAALPAAPAAGVAAAIVQLPGLPVPGLAEILSSRPPHLLPFAQPPPALL